MAWHKLPLHFRGIEGLNHLRISQPDSMAWTAQMHALTPTALPQ